MLKYVSINTEIARQYGVNIAYVLAYLKKYNALIDTSKIFNVTYIRISDETGLSFNEARNAIAKCIKYKLIKQYKKNKAQNTKNYYKILG